MAVVDINAAQYINSITNYSSSTQIYDGLKRDFVQVMLGCNIVDSVEKQRNILENIKYVRASLENGALDKENADFMLRILLANLMDIKFTDLFDNWLSKRYGCNSNWQLMLPGME
jgi:hypothetical protein